MFLHLDAYRELNLLRRREAVGIHDMILRTNLPVRCDPDHIRPFKFNLKASGKQ